MIEYYKNNYIYCCKKSLGHLPTECQIGAFLHGILEEVVHIQQTKEYMIKGEEDEVYRLYKAFYGLKHAPRAWFSPIEEYFAKEGFEKFENKETFFIKTNKHGNSLYVSVYIDDLIYRGGDMVMIE